MMAVSSAATCVYMSGHGNAWLHSNTTTYLEMENNEGENLIIINNISTEYIRV